VGATAGREYISGVRTRSAVRIFTRMRVKHMDQIRSRAAILMVVLARLSADASMKERGFGEENCLGVGRLHSGDGGSRSERLEAWRRSHGFQKASTQATSIPRPACSISIASPANGSTYYLPGSAQEQALLDLDLIPVRWRPAAENDAARQGLSSDPLCWHTLPHVVINGIKGDRQREREPRLIML